MIFNSKKGVLDFFLLGIFIGVFGALILVLMKYSATLDGLNNMPKLGQTQYKLTSGLSNFELFYLKYDYLANYDLNNAYYQFLENSGSFKSSNTNYSLDTYRGYYTLNEVNLNSNYNKVLTSYFVTKFKETLLENGIQLNDFESGYKNGNWFLKSNSNIEFNPLISGLSQNYFDTSLQSTSSSFQNIYLSNSIWSGLGGCDGKGGVYESPKNTKATLENVYFTVYYTPSYDGTTSWQNYANTFVKSWCKLKNKGFYEDVKCQGSGVLRNVKDPDRKGYPDAYCYHGFDNVKSNSIVKQVPKYSNCMYVCKMDKKKLKSEFQCTRKGFETFLTNLELEYENTNNKNYYFCPYNNYPNIPTNICKPLDIKINGVTAFQTNAKPLETVAVSSKLLKDYKKDSFYIEFSDKSQTCQDLYNGVFKFEDTGNAMNDKEYGGKRIDIYAGVGKEQKNKVVNCLSGSTKNKLWKVKSTTKISKLKENTKLNAVESSGIIEKTNNNEFKEFQLASTNEKLTCNPGTTIIYQDSVTPNNFKDIKPYKNLINKNAPYSKKGAEKLVNYILNEIKNKGATSKPGSSNLCSQNVRVTIAKAGLNPEIAGVYHLNAWDVPAFYASNPKLASRLVYLGDGLTDKEALKLLKPGDIVFYSLTTALNWGGYLREGSNGLNEPKSLPKQKNIVSKEGYFCHNGVIDFRNIGSNAYYWRCTYDSKNRFNQPYIKKLYSESAKQNYYLENYPTITHIGFFLGSSGPSTPENIKKFKKKYPGLEFKPNRVIFSDNNHLARYYYKITAIVRPNYQSYDSFSFNEDWIKRG